MVLRELAVIRVTSITLKQTGALRSYSQKTQHALRHSAMTTNWDMATIKAHSGWLWLRVFVVWTFSFQQPNQKQLKAPGLTLIISVIKLCQVIGCLTSSWCWSGCVPSHPSARPLTSPVTMQVRLFQVKCSCFSQRESFFTGINLRNVSNKNKSQRWGQRGWTIKGLKEGRRRKRCHSLTVVWVTSVCSTLTKTHKCVSH